MAANLTGMFAQLNDAISNSPLANGGGDRLLAGASKGFGGAAGAATGRDPYSFMSDGGRQVQGRQDLMGLDFSKSKDLMEGAEIYSKMGNQKEALAMATAGRNLQKAQAEELEAGSEEMNREVDNKRLMSEAMMKGDMELVKALRSGAMTAQDYYKSQYEAQLKIKSHLAMNPTDPYEGAFTQKVTMGGKEVPIRFAKNGKPIQVLGEGRGDYSTEEIYNPASGTMQAALINKLNPGEIQFLGAAEPIIPTFDVKESGGNFHVWESVPGGEPQIVAQYDNLTEAQKAQKRATADMRSLNQVATIDEAISMIDDDDSWVGGVESWALKYLPETDARNFEGLITSVKANVGFEELRNLKAEGGTLGQVSNIENILLQSAIRQLDSAAKPDDLRTALETIKGVKLRIRNASTLADPKAADAYFKAEMDVNGMPTGNKFYYVNQDSLAKIGPNGEYLGLIQR